MEIETRMGEALGRYLDLANSEIKLTAANMANIDTPGYKAIGLDFEAEMHQALGDVNKGNSGRPARVRVVDGLIARPDGNDVSMDRESLNPGRGAVEVPSRRDAACAPKTSASWTHNPGRQQVVRRDSHASRVP